LAVERLDGVDAVAGGTLTALSGDDVLLTREAGHDGDGEFVVRRTRATPPGLNSSAGLKPCPTPCPCRGCPGLLL
jgi:hypothetical protein